jgi:hypothetical protein
MAPSSSFGIRTLFPALIVAAASAQSITGQIVDINNAGIQGVRVDPGATGVSPVNTDVNGNFTVAVPAATYTVSIQPRTLPYAPVQVANVVVAGTAATSIGVVTLQPGFVVSGTVLGPGNVPVAGGKVNVYDDVTGVKQYEPGNSIGATGAFAVTVAAGTWRLRYAPPTGSTVLPIEQHNVVVTNAAVSVGTILLQQGYAVSGTVVDAATAQPLANVKMNLFDGATHDGVLLLNDRTDTLGNFVAITPYGVVDLQFEPVAGDTHVGRELFDVFVEHNLSLGQVLMQNGVLVSGTVTGPAGPLQDAKIKLFDIDGNRLYVAHEHTDALGTFTIAAVTGLHVAIVEPPDGTNLVGMSTGFMPFAGPTNLGTLSLSPGVAFSGTITGPNGGEQNATLRVFDQLTGQEAVFGNETTDLAGNFSIVLPNGTWNVQVLPQESSHAATIMFPGVVVSGPTVWNCVLPASPMFVQVDSIGVPTLPVGAALPVNVIVANQAGVTLHTCVEVVIRFASGAEQPLLSPIYLDLPAQFSFTFLDVEFVLPQVPQSQVGKQLEFVVRFRDPLTRLVQDEDSALFVIG